MSPAAESGFAFVVLLRDGDDASGLARLLEDVRLPQAATPSVFAAPPVRGVDFFADEPSQPALDRWWAENIPGNAVPIFLLNHEDGLPEWTAGLDGTLYIGLPAPAAADLYPDTDRIKSFMSGGPLDFATVIMRDFSGGQGGGAVLFDEGEALRMAALSSDFPIDLDDSAFDFGDAEPEPAGAAVGPAGAQTAYGSGFGGVPGFPGGAPAGGGAGGNPFDSFVTGFTNPEFGAAPLAAPPPVTQRKRTPAASPTTAHPFDLMSGGTAPAGTPPPPPGFGGPTAPPPPAPPPGWNGGMPTAPPPSGPPSSASGMPTAPPPMGSPPMLPPPPPGPPPGWAPGGSQSLPPMQMPSGGGSWDMPGMGNGTGYGAQVAGGGFSPPPPTNGGTKSRGGKFSFGDLLPGGKKGKGFVETPVRELAQMMVDRGPTIVVMGSRKGGVGKTSYAAGISIVAGTILDTIGHKAAIVDANIANPDAWGQMNLREGAATVRQVVAALTANSEPPQPVHAMTPALACYPESRETTEYSKTDIKRFAEYLRRRFTFIVVDMSNRLPDPMAGPESAAAAFWLEHADVLILPTTSSKQDFNGVLDYLDVRGLPPTVVPYIIPNVKRNRDHPVTQQYLSVIRDRVHRIVEIPDEADKVRYAGMEGKPVEQVSPTLRIAYRELTEVVVRVPPRARL